MFVVWLTPWYARKPKLVDVLHIGMLLNAGHLFFDFEVTYMFYDVVVCTPFVTFSNVSHY